MTSVPPNGLLRIELKHAKELNAELLAALEHVETVAEDHHAFDDLECFMDDPETRKDYEEEYTLRKIVRAAIAKAKAP